MTTREAKTKASASWLVDGLHPTLRDETAKDGAPGRRAVVRGRSIRPLRGWLLCGQIFERRGSDELGVTRVVEDEGEVAVLLVNNAIAPSVEPGDRPKCLTGAEPAMKLDAELPNGDVLVEELVDDVELEPFDVHLQEVDVRVVARS